MDPREEDIIGYVRAGYLTAESIVDAICEDSDDDRAAVAALVHARMAERRREIDLAGRPSAHARLRSAFDRLEEHGVLAREAYWCCQTCAYSAIDEEIAEASADGSPPRGYVFFHDQDTDRAVESGLLLIRYGGVTADPAREGAAASKLIGQELVTVLRAYDFDPQWSGSADDTIVVPITWDKRPPDALN